MRRGLGCLLDTADPRDRPAASLLLQSGPQLRSSVFLYDEALYGMFQYEYGACVGFGIANNVYIRQGKLGVPRSRRIYPSPWDIYYRARARARYPYGIADLGANPRNGWMTLRAAELGVVPVANWPPIAPARWADEIAGYVNKAPDPGCYRYAADHQWLSFFYLQSTGPSRAAEVDALLNQGYPVSARILVDAPYKQWTIRDGAWKRTQTAEGGHYVCILGKEPAGYWHINSWSDWGEGQLGLIAPEYLESDEMGSFVACEIDVEKLPW